MIANELIRLTSNRVYFNPSDAEHRQIVAQFLRTQSWKHTEKRFYIEFPYTDMVSFVVAKLAHYYTEQEFSGINVFEVHNNHS